MQTVILCGGFGTRLSEETQSIPKPMVTVGGRPILWHILNMYSSYGYNDFALALGYKSEIIKDYFLNYHALNSDLHVDLGTGQVDYKKTRTPEWKLNLVDTGLDTLTGGRVKRFEPLLRDQGTFMLTYGDGVCDVDIKKLVEFHKSHGKLATVTAVRPTARFGGLRFDGDKVTEFQEKPQAGEGWINGGFFVFEPQVFDYFTGDQTILEREPLENLAKEGNLMAYRHEGFWQCMDTVRDRQLLEEEWATGKAPWKVW